MSEISTLGAAAEYLRDYASRRRATGAEIRAAEIDNLADRLEAAGDWLADDQLPEHDRNSHAREVLNLIEEGELANE